VSRSQACILTANSKLVSVGGECLGLATHV